MDIIILRELRYWKDCVDRMWTTNRWNAQCAVYSEHWAHNEHRIQNEWKNDQKITKMDTIRFCSSACRWFFFLFICLVENYRFCGWSSKCAYGMLFCWLFSRQQQNLKKKKTEAKMKLIFIFYMRSTCFDGFFSSSVFHHFVKGIWT